METGASVPGYRGKLIHFPTRACHCFTAQTQSDALGFHRSPRWGWEGVVRRAASSLWTRGPPDRGSFSKLTRRVSAELFLSIS